MRRTELWCRMNGLIYLGVDFITSPLGNAPPRSKKQLKGKGAVGESSTSQEEAPEIPLPSEPEQVINLEEEFMEDVPEGPSTQDVGVATTTEVPSVPSSSLPPLPQVSATTPLVVSSPPSSTLSPASSSIFSSLVDLSPSISSLISGLPSLPMSSAAPVSLPPVDTSAAILSMPPPRVSTFFPSSTVAASPSVSGPFFNRTSLDLSAAEPAKEESPHHSDGLFRLFRLKEQRSTSRLHASQRALQVRESWK
ncbi:hypothetical protein KI387_044220 [Taxus chinensis]|uniref:Uncharacterized protein n=1 Tax=Taxus chinensis TaxID=29808 RepID=A0AA38FUL9_TAXCH|nr:hypothetical protein KI387_044220 [Taxus chinensis]